jgi:hypothetical protein
LSDSSSTRDEINDEDAKLLKDILEQTSGINQEKMDKVARFYQSRKAKFQENPLLIYNLLTEAGLSPYRAQAGSCYPRLTSLPPVQDGARKFNLLML